MYIQITYSSSLLCNSYKINLPVIKKFQPEASFVNQMWNGDMSNSKSELQCIRILLFYAICRRQKAEMNSEHHFKIQASDTGFQLFIVYHAAAGNPIL